MLDKPEACQMAVWKAPRSIFGIARTLQYKLMFDDGSVETLSAAEARELQDGLLIEWCMQHSAFHPSPDFYVLDLVNWLVELRRP